MLYASTTEAARFYGVSTRTIIRWCDNSKVEHYYTPTGNRKIRLIDRGKSNNEERILSKQCICYCRVSTSKQRDDLQRQVDYMADKFPGYRIVKDIGSGLNFKRKGLLSILELVETGNVQSIVVASKDRLARFGFELLEWLCRRQKVEILVLDRDNDKSPEQELVQDVLSVIQVFNCKWNGRRRYSLSKMQKDKVTSLLGSEEKTFEIRKSV
jgi:predicted site-specific integrase-resolvase